MKLLYCLIIRCQFKSSNHVHQPLPGSTGFPWPGQARLGRFLADSEALAPHPHALCSYSCGAVAAACAPLKLCPNKCITSLERNTFYHMSKHTQQLKGLVDRENIPNMVLCFSTRQEKKSIWFGKDTVRTELFPETKSNVWWMKEPVYTSLLFRDNKSPAGHGGCLTLYSTIW